MKKQTQINYLKSQLRLKQKEVEEYKGIIKMVNNNMDWDGNNMKEMNGGENS